MPVVECDPEDARTQLEDAGIETTAGNTDHERWRAEHGGATAVAYDDKVVVQGASPEALLGHLKAGSGRAYVYFDGGSRGNPGPAAIGWVVVSDEGIVAEDGRRIGKATNNQAEYRALVAGLEAALAAGFEELHVRGDAELIVKQVRGEYEVHDATLREYRLTVRELLERAEEWAIQHVPREANDRADALVNEALDG